MSDGGGWTKGFVDEPRQSGVFLDFDGTISDIAPIPGEARLNPRAADLLPRLSHRYPLCVMSGGKAKRLAELVGLPRIHYVGVNGMEWLEGNTRTEPEVLPHLPALDRVREEIVPALESLPGIDMEDKLVTLALHYRSVPELEEQVLDLAQRVSEPLRMEVKRGRKVAEIVPPVVVDKGTVLVRLARGWRLRRALYAGDDLSDVAGFRGLRYLMKEGLFEGVAIAVLSPETPIELEAVADLTVHGVDGLINLLQTLL
ncbi:MAG: trehalose-phosphatase [Actinomycetota bacterium]|nr:trehalose-phosphatase [Actinomycetota bacterium]